MLANQLDALKGAKVTQVFFDHRIGFLVQGTRGNFEITFESDFEWQKKGKILKISRKNLASLEGILELFNLELENVEVSDDWTLVVTLKGLGQLRCPAIPNFEAWGIAGAGLSLTAPPQ